MWDTAGVNRSLPKGESRLRSCKGRTVVSHISRTTSEMWGTRHLLRGKIPSFVTGNDPFISCGERSLHLFGEGFPFIRYGERFPVFAAGKISRYVCCGEGFLVPFSGECRRPRTCRPGRPLPRRRRPGPCGCRAHGLPPAPGPSQSRRWPPRRRRVDRHAPNQEKS